MKKQELSPSPRRYDWDALKVVATAAVFVFHCLRFFDLHPWHLKNNQLEPIATILADVLLQWIMPLFFLLSGASIFLSLQSRSVKQFLQERVMRLLVPLLLGIFILSPPQVYLERLANPSYGVAPWSQGQFEGSFFAFIPYYFQGWYLFGGNFAWMGIHLWYLLVLLLFSVLLLPLFLTIKRSTAWVTALANWLEKPGAIFLLALPIVCAESGLDPTALGVRAAGGWNFFTYLILVLYGYLMALEPRFEQAVHRHLWPAVLWVGCTAVPLSILMLNQFQAPLNYGAWDYTLVMSLRSVTAWSWMIAGLGIGKKWLDVNHPGLPYLTEAALPFYLLHQPVILAIGFWIGPWPQGVGLKFCLLSGASLVVIALLYALGVRRINLVRVLFGLKSMSTPYSRSGGRLQ